MGDSIVGVPGENSLDALKREFAQTLVRWPKDFGRVALIRGFPDKYLLRSPADLKHVLALRRHNYPKQTVPGADLLLGEGLLMSDEPQSSFHRALVRPAFHRDFLSECLSTMTKESMRLIDRWSALSEIDPAAEMRTFTFDVLAKTLLGLDDNKIVRELYSLVVSLTISVSRITKDLTTRPPVSLPREMERFRWQVQSLNTIVDDIVAEGVNNQDEGRNLVSLVLREWRDESRTPSKKDLRDSLVNLLWAGTSTTAVGISWMFHCLARSPDSVRLLSSSIPDKPPEDPLSFTALHSLTLLDDAFSEALRLHPPEWMLIRAAREEDVLPSGAIIPKGSTILMSPWTTQRNPDYFPSPEAFNPARFSSDQSLSIPDCAYFPWGFGSRKCIAEPFARLEAVTVLYHVLTRMDLVPPENGRTAPNEFERWPSGVLNVSLRDGRGQAA